MTTTPLDLQKLTVEGIREVFSREPLTLSVHRLAELLGQESSATYQQLRDGQIPATLRNGRWLIYSKTICNWLISHHTTEGNHREDR